MSGFVTEANMKLNSSVLNFSLSIFLLLSSVAPASANQWTNEIYSQSVYLHRFGNPVTQNRVIVAKEMKSYFANQVIEAINQDAVIRMTAPIDTIERVVEIIEAVRDIGQAQETEETL